MPPRGGVRTSLSFSVTGYGPMNAAFQPTNGVFSPGLPLTPAAPQPTRAFDFNVGANTITTPRAGFANVHSFASLRAYANVELVRLAIETRKDQIERLDWQIKPIDAKAKGADGDIKTLTKLWKKPDGVTPFATWLRLAMEDLLVIDAPAFEKRRNRGGSIIGLDVVQGDTFKLLVDENGRRPLPPIPAYQQIIKGMVWNSLTTDDLLYVPRNPRPNHLYGFGPVEQIIVTINTIMRRQGVQLAYFTDSSVPAGILNAPAGWSADNIRTMQDAWDARTEGDVTFKNKLQWVPEGTKYQAFKESPLKDDFDEWLARVVAYAFSLPPTPFIRQMNRSTGQTDQDRGLEEGLEPVKLWVKRFIDGVIQDDMGFDGLEFAWNDTPEIDPAIQSQIDDRNLKNGSAVIDEVRDARGQDPLPEGQGAKPLLYTSTGAVTLEQVLKASEDAMAPPEPIKPQALLPDGTPDPAATTGASTGEPPSGAEQAANGVDGAKHGQNVGTKEPAAKLAKAAVSRDRPVVRRAETRMRKAIAAKFKALGHDVAVEAESKLKAFGKAADDGSKIIPAAAQEIAGSADLSSLDDLIAGLVDDLFDVASDSGQIALAQLGVTSSDDLTNQVNARAVAYAKNRAAQLVSAQGDENIIASTRNMIRDVIVSGLEDNIGAAAIADNIEASTAFSPARAETIAKYEIASANSKGAMDGGREAKALGLVITKAWLISGDGDCCDECQDNADAGWIDIDEDFPSGDDSDPAHPNCQCSTTMRASEEGDED